MNCRFDEKILHLYVDSELGEHTRSKLEEHLAYCEECKRIVESIIAMKTALAATCSTVKAPAHLYARISDSLEPALASRLTKLNLKEKLGLITLGFQASRRWAIGVVFALLLIFILFPGKRGLQSRGVRIANR